jgi:methionyl-tRNA synthetase
MHNTRKIFIGAAWPYANGSLHLGHASALIGSDILARYFRLHGDDVLFVSGSDCHGTPIAFEADRQGVSPSEIAEKYHKEFTETLIDGLGFSYDIFTKTATENHYKFVQEIFLDLYKKGFIYSKETELPYCKKCNKFLPDRYIEGECPHCHFSSARGDQCDECGSLIDPKQLIKPKCKICGNVPVWKNSEHFYFKLSAFQEKILEWIKNSKGWRKNAKNFSTNFVNRGLQDRAITRDISWGVPIPLPGYEKNKSIYVWFEAVCGYISACKEISIKIGNNDLWKDFWQNENSIHYYVHGKDNIPFHTIIWPSILFAYGNLHLPDRIISSEYLTLQGKQFSKSRRWAVWLPDFVKNFDSDTLRYYLIANGPETSDSDFSWKEYQTKTNTELIGHFGNLVNRVFSFVAKNFPEGLIFPEELDKNEALFLKAAEEAFEKVGQAIEAGKFHEGLNLIFKLVEKSNHYLNDTSPWTAIKTDRKKAERSLAITGHIIKCISVLISPYLPKTSQKISLDIDFELKEWSYPKHSTLVVHNFKPLYKKIEDSQIEKEKEKLLS